MQTSDFLASISDDRKLSEITIPGSHDAGVYVGSATTVGPSANKWAICQHFGLMNQCRHGSRFFDIRVIEHGGQIVAHHSNKVAGKRMGSTGGGLSAMLGELMAFLDAVPSEFVIARFSKSKPEKQVVDTVLDICDKRLMKGGGNLASQPLGALRGKILAVFDTETFGGHVKAGAGIHPFFKYPQVENYGLTFCGKYANNNNIIQVYLDQIEKLQDHDRHVGDHLNVTYWTQTSPKVFSAQRNVQEMAQGGAKQMSMDDGMGRLRDRLGSQRNGGVIAYETNKKLIAAAKKHRKNGPMPPATLPNIVMYDFVNSAASVPIIALNWPHLRFTAS